MTRTYHTTRVTTVETAPSLPEAPRARRVPPVAAPAAFQVGDRILVPVEIIAAPLRNTPDSEWSIKVIGVEYIPGSFTTEELAAGMRIPR